MINKHSFYLISNYINIYDIVNIVAICKPKNIEVIQQYSNYVKFQCFQKINTENFIKEISPYLQIRDQVIKIITNEILIFNSEISKIETTEYIYRQLTKELKINTIYNKI